MVEVFDGSDPKKLSKLMTDLQWTSGTWFALIACSALAEQLKMIIAFKMVRLSKTFNEEVFGTSSPLGTFSSRITMARALGIIDVRTYSKLNEIRKIRNELAHSHEFLHFDHERIRKLFHLIRPSERKGHSYLNGYLEEVDRIMLQLKVSLDKLPAR